MSNRELDTKSVVARLDGVDAGGGQWRSQLATLVQSMHAAREARAAVLGRWIDWEQEQFTDTAEAITDLAQCAQDCASATDLDMLRKRQAAYATTLVELTAKRHRAFMQVATEMTQTVMGASLSVNAKLR